MSKIKESRTGGFLLISGTLVFLITVYFEYDIGWIGFQGGPDNPYDFVRSNWSGLEKIWFWQMIGGLLSLIAYFLFFKVSKGLKSVIWAVLAIGSLLSTAAFLLTLGSYGPALDVYDSSPELFETVRGGISALYHNIMIGPLLFLLLFCLETFGKDGIIKRNLGIASLGLFVVLLVLGFVAEVYVKITGLSYFILPLVFGYSALKESEA